MNHFRREYLSDYNTIIITVSHCILCNTVIFQSVTFQSLLGSFARVSSVTCETYLCFFF